MPKKKRNSLMTRAAVTLMILILPFNIIGIVTSVVSYRSTIKNAEAAISHSLDSYGLLLDNRIRNTNSVLYELTHNNAVLFNMCHSTDESSYKILRYQFFSGMNDEIKTSDIADSWFFYQTRWDDYIPLPAYTGSNAGSRPYFGYIEDYDISFSRWFFSDDHRQLLRILYDNSLNLYCGAVFDLEALLGGLNGIGDYDSLRYDFREDEPEAKSERQSATAKGEKLIRAYGYRTSIPYGKGKTEEDRD